MDILQGTGMVKAAILGTAVADASGMGLHWIYSQGKIAQIVEAAGGTAEFQEPNPANYEGVPAFFAHPHKQGGDASNYGEYLYVLLRALSEQGFDRSAYITAFGEHFGVGGTYVGYADRPMRETICIMMRQEDKAETRGPDDDQMPALSRSAVLAHFYSGAELDATVEQAVRMSNNNDKAVRYSRFFAHLMRALYENGHPAPEQAPQLLSSVITQHTSCLAADEQDLVKQAMAYESLNYRDAGKRFGAACHVDMAVPLTIHILLNTGSFREANRVNILASGDNCGRAVMLGAVAGALYGLGGEHGIPEDWIRRSTLVQRLLHTDGGQLLLE